MARHRDPAVPEAVYGLREYVYRRLREIEDLLQRRGTRMMWLYRKAYGLDRIRRLERGEPVMVRGWDIRPALPSAERERIDPDAWYTLEPDGRLRRR